MPPSPEPRIVVRERLPARGIRSSPPSTRSRKDGSERPVLDVETAKRFADLGVRRLILYQPRARDEGAMLRVVEQAAHDLVGKLTA